LIPGQYFGEVELVRGGKSIASVRASGDSQVELLALTRADFHQLLKESPLTEEAIGRMVQHRLEENKSTDRRGRRFWPFG
jgi:CRP-like cAMP-binding protein